MELTPSFNGSRPPGERTCGYGTPDNHCGRLATWHILWTVQGDNSLDCDEHMAKAQTRWVYFARHPLSPDCTLKGAIWRKDRCVVEGQERRGASYRVVSNQARP